MNNTDLIFNINNFRPKRDDENYQLWYQEMWIDWVDYTVDSLLNINWTIWRAPRVGIVDDFNRVPFPQGRQLLIKFENTTDTLKQFSGETIHLIRLSHSPSYKEIWKLCDQAYPVIMQNLKQPLKSQYFLICSLSYDNKGTIIVGII